MDYIKTNYEWVVTGKKSDDVYNQKSLAYHGHDIFEALDSAIDHGMFDITKIEMTGTVR